MRLAALLLMLVFVSRGFAQQPTPPELTIFISPLSAIGEDGKTAWISQAVQQNILHELTRVQGVKPVLPAAPPADHNAAVTAAKSAGAHFLLEGSYTLADPGIRITIQVFDLKTNAYIGAAKATGPLKELFALEDSIAEQIHRIVQHQVNLRAPAAAPQQPLPPIAIPGNGPVQQPQYPWDRDKPFIANEIRKTLLDRDYEDSRYRTTYTYPASGYYGSGYYGYGFAGYYRPYYGGFYRPAFRGAYFFPNGFISASW
jgi:TolB-like protein